MTIKLKYVFALVLVVIIATFFVGRYIGHKKGDDAYNASISYLNTRINTYKVIIGDQQKFVSQKEQVIMTMKEARKADSISREELRKLNIKQLNEISRLKFRIDTLLSDVNNSGGVIVIHDTITLKPTSYVKLPFVVTKNDQWLSLKDSTDIKGKTSISLKMNIGVDVYAGIDKTTKKPTVSVVSGNPYLNTIQINSIKMDAVKVKKYGIGLFIGYGINLNGTIKASPIVGVGVGWNFIRW